MAGNPIIFIVDDDEAVRDSLSMLIESVGMKTETFGSCREFLAKTALPQHACLLLDVSMPGMNGLALQRRLAETGRQIPIVFLSARASEDEERRALQAGAAKCLHKPASKEVLLQAIRAALDGGTN